MKKLYFYFICSLAMFSINAQQWTSAMNVPGSYLGRMDEDNLGNLYTAIGLTYNSSGYISELTKRDISGQVVWTTTLNCSIYGIKTTNASLAFTGTFTGTISIGNFTLSSLDGVDAFVASCDLNGNVKWVKHCAGISDNYIYNLEQSSTGDIFVAATNDSTTAFAGQTFNSGIAVCVLDSTGSLVNHFSIYSPKISAGIAIDRQNNIYLLGTYYQQNLAIGSATLTTGDIYYGSYFLAKLHQNGAAYWAKNLGSVYKTHLSNVGINGNQDIYYAICTTYEDDRLIKLASDGTQIWDKKFGGEMYGEINDLKIDNSNNIYITGGTWYGATIGSCTVAGTGNFLYVAKADSSGACFWTAKGQSASDSRGLKMSIKTSALTILGFTMSNPIQLSPLSVNGSYFLGRISQNGISGLKNELSVNNIEAYPNPTNGLFNLYLREETSLVVYNVAGTCVYKNKAGPGEKKIDLSHQPKGLYFLEASNGSFKSVKKIVVE